MMAIKISERTRKILFALVMSCNTSLIVSGIVIYKHTQSHEHFIIQWLGAFISVWPIVFVAILIIVPLVNKLLDYFFEDK
ncbi:MAG: DUF2798 domain-containing protein [Methylotenera sp.]|nr:DUF2798 domain-containing protein [Methylotenera sp.]MDD4927299.1 DUF2798 domain-containing protein [Methylotenera sp.]